MCSYAPGNEKSSCKSSSGQGVRQARKVASLAIDQNKRAKREIILEARKEQRTVHFATLMDICHLETAQLEPKYQKHKGRVVL